MFGFFAKKEIDVSAAKAFWNWFSEHEEWIISTINTDGMSVVWAIDEQIKPIFPYYKKELEFQLGFNEGKGEFFFFHFGDKALQKDADILKNMMPDAIAQRWIFISEKSKPPVNWWFDQPLEGANTGVAPKRGTESLTPHYNHRQPLTCGCLFLPIYSCYP